MTTNEYFFNGDENVLKVIVMMGTQGWDYKNH